MKIVFKITDSGEAPVFPAGVGGACQVSCHCCPISYVTDI